MILQLVRFYPFGAFVVFTALSSYLALQPLPSSVPLIAFLSILRLETTLVIHRPWTFVRLVAIWAAIFIGCFFSFVGLRFGSPEAPVVTASYAVIFSLLGLFIVVLAAYCGSNNFVFPALWATWWLVIAQMSPVGRLGAWSPLIGDDTYSWLRPHVSDFGIDWIVGASAEVLSCFVTWHVLGFNQRHQNDDGNERRDHRNEEGDLQTERVDSGRVKFLLFILIALSFPSSLTELLPEPLHEDNRHDVGVSCVLPDLSGPRTSFDAFMNETAIVAGRAHVALWPEDAVFFETEQDKETGLIKAQELSHQYGIFIGVSFLEPLLEEGEDRGKRRSGTVLVGKDGVMAEYYGRHPAPFSKRVPERSLPGIVNITLGRKNTKHFWEMRLSASIGLDFAHPYSHFDAKPQLILGPARTDHRKMAQVMMEMARHRAQELRTTILWCDGSDSGLSGLVGSGHTRKQVGPGTWVERMVARIPSEEEWTLYELYGAFFGLLCAWAPIVLPMIPLPDIRITFPDPKPRRANVAGRLNWLLRRKRPQRDVRTGTLVEI
ncbi:SubName: Full=Uncharacterized protein {ECO:0000313/EMBL:CCA67152.1} [Serendipita indica DSM 11827]|nr:SubName: Full=Uncharacterized protein {ECO:0000313/EMBL:CCA67152.1} [Serendipita indica DSM 11827]